MHIMALIPTRLRSTEKNRTLSDPRTISNELYGVAGISTSDVWAVGMYGKSDGLNVTSQTLVERYTVP